MGSYWKLGVVIEYVEILRFYRIWIDEGREYCRNRRVLIKLLESGLLVIDILFYFEFLIVRVNEYLILKEVVN